MMWSIYFSGLLSEKSDDSLFFLDVGQPKKAEQKGKYVKSSYTSINHWYSDGHMKL